MQFRVNIAAAAERAAALPPELETIDDVPEGLRSLYIEKDGKFALDAEQRDRFVGDLQRVDAKAKLDAERADLEDEKNRRIVVAIIKRNLAQQGVGEQHLHVVAMAFLASHQIAIRERAGGGGHSVRVLGNRGDTPEELEVAAVRWCRGDAKAFTDHEMESSDKSGGFASQLRNLRIN